MNQPFDELFSAAFHQFSKGEVVLRIFGKVLLVCAMFFTGCANERESATEPFFPNRNLAQYSGENGDEIAYWDGAGSSGKPRIVIDLEQQRAYFYKGGKIVGISVVSTGREGYDTPSGEFRIIQKDLTHVSSIYGDYVDRNGQVVMENVDVTKDRRPRGTVFRGAPMPYFLRIHGALACMPVICPAIRRHTAVFACLKKWQFIFSKMRQSAPRWRFGKSHRRTMSPVHLMVRDTRPLVRSWSAENSNVSMRCIRLLVGRRPSSDDKTDIPDPASQTEQIRSKRGRGALSQRIHAKRCAPPSPEYDALSAWRPTGCGGHDRRVHSNRSTLP